MTSSQAPPRRSGSDPLSILEVIDRLEVGPVELAPDRLRAPYRVTRSGQTQVMELAYRYQGAVFEPAEPASRNLADLIAAQVALNYGLFCREIVFHGAFDRSDRRFLLDMMANTAREIYVKKLLQPNPFLLPEVSELPVERRSSYVRARVTFAAEPPSEEMASWNGSPERFAVLSSGGKDSLLSFGLLRELGYETHPVFLNESGRHWFTALNAYRRFEKEVPHTQRVWTNSDRLFNWMLRHLPFVRPDFQRLRADEYPIRLWTVAVFLFGALPILRRERAGRLIIGDEHDTTVRASYRGIKHYDGLYDQSRFFDDTMSRFFAAKSWRLTQFSLLRPLSELLIQGLLARRYPDLLRLQVSCHAAHEDAGVIRPCGRCEKCRRIVGMLLAADGDPTACGYRPEQITAAREHLVDKGVHQEKPAVQNLAARLWERDLIREPRLGGIKARARPEISKLRFHSVRSPIDSVPLSLREPLYRIFLSHAEGAVRNLGQQWVDFNLLTDPELVAPYFFDRPRPQRAAGGSTRKRESASATSSSVLWSQLTWPEAESYLKQVDIALLPVGAIEQHGPHLPLDVDAFDAEYLARKVAEACSRPQPLVLPLIAYGVSYHHDDFPGTLSVSNETLARLVYEIGMSAAANGIAKLVIINGHGGNAATLHFAAQMINRDARIFTCVESGETSDPEIFALAETRNDVHAGEIETSTTLAVRPELVQMSKAEPFVPRFSTHYLDFTSLHSVDWYARTSKISKSGVFGDPTKASREKGEAFWKLSIDHLVGLVEHLKELTLSEIHDQRI